VTKSTVLGTGRVITWDVLEKRQAEHAVEEARKAEKEAKKAARQAKKITNVTVRKETTKGKAKRSRKRKSTASEATDTTEPKAKVVRRREKQVAGTYHGIDALELDTQVQDVGVLQES
jgi:sRNA-binding protein